MSYPSDASAVREACDSIATCLDRIEAKLDEAVKAQPSWLDQAAMMAMQALVEAHGVIGVVYMAKLTEPGQAGGLDLARASYNIAHALWAEKQRREAGGGK